MQKITSFLLTNWKTTLAGVAAIVVEIARSNGVESPAWTSIVLLGLGLGASRDADKSSESSKVK